MTDFLTSILTVIYAMLGSAAAAYYWWKNNQVDPTKPTDAGYKIKKALPTVLVGACIGIASVIWGVEPVTGINAAIMMAQYGLVTSVVDTGLKTICRYFNILQYPDE